MQKQMMWTSLFALGLTAAGCAGGDSGAEHAEAAVAAANPSEAEAAWQPLFDGQSLEGWRNPYDHGKAWVENEEIHLQADKKFFLVTEKEYGDFVFEGEVLLPDTLSNAGFMFRANVEPNKVYGYQAEVDPKSRRWAGGLYDEARRGWLNPAKGDEAAGKAFREGPGTAFQPDQWNKYRIEARGDSLKIWVNDVLTTAYQDSEDQKGHLGIQHHGEKGKIYRYRNLRIRELK